MIGFLGLGGEMEVQFYGRDNKKSGAQQQVRPSNFNFLYVSKVAVV
jgi:hypothetical protein